MQATVEWRGDSRYEGHTESGHSVTIDAGSTHEAGPGPLELVLLGLCSCTSVDVVSVLRKKREPLAALSVSAVAEQADAPPRVFTHIRLVYRVAGKVSPKAVEDAVSLSQNKYCPVSKMLEKTATIDFSIEYADANSEGGK